MQRRNNFDLLRLMAASAVIVSHAFALLGEHDPMPVAAGADLGRLGVGVFFVISGYLITLSWQRDPRPGPFLARRVRRIFPGLGVALLFDVLVVGPLATSWSFGRYLASPATWTYLVDNFVLAPVYALPGVFTFHRVTGVNGSLWTLPYEFAMYGTLPLLAALGLLRWRGGRVATPLLLVIGLFGQADPPSFGLADGIGGTYLPLLGTYFAAGMVLAIYRDRLRLRGWVSAVLLACWGISWLTPDGGLVASITLPYVVIWLAQATLPAWCSRLTARGDISYGLYIYGFPIEQLIISLLGGHASPGIVIALGWPTTAALAMLSWVFVERPVLRLRRRSAPETASASLPVAA